MILSFLSTWWIRFSLKNHYVLIDLNILWISFFCSDYPHWYLDSLIFSHWAPLKVKFLNHFDRTLSSLLASLLSMKRHSWLNLYIFCLIPGISCFSLMLWFLLGEKGVWRPQSEDFKCYLLLGWSFSRPFQLTELGMYYLYMLQIYEFMQLLTVWLIVILRLYFICILCWESWF